MMKNRYLWLLSMVVVVAACSGAVQATVIAGDPAALVSGQQSFSTPIWMAEVQYAVYAPGAYPGTQVDKNTNYVYAYQVFSGNTSLPNLDAFSIALEVDSGAVHPGFDAGYGTLGGIAPLLSRLTGHPPTTASWAFDIPANQYSTVLTYSSPYSYTWTDSNVANGGTGNTHLLPSPVPEPASMCLLIAGGLALIRRRSV